MSNVKALIAGLIGGAIGAALWAALAYGANREFAWIAWIIGALVGISVRVGAGDQAGGLSGVIAAILALSSIAGGKYATVHMIVSKKAAEIQAKADAELAKPLSDDDAIMLIAEDHVADAVAKDHKLLWPKGQDADSEHNALTDFPDSIVRSAKAEWKAKSPEDRQDFKDQTIAKRREITKTIIADFKSTVERKGFLMMLGPYDFLFGALAVFSAFRIGSGSSSGD